MSVLRHREDQRAARLDAMVALLRNRRVLVLAGAGCSTESGIPDYRGPEGKLRFRTPVQYGDFVRSAEARARYWARSTVGWSRIRDARPNAAHEALARLEQGGVVHGLITQNVDGLHHAAGNRRVIELHGLLARVCCLACAARSGRAAFQERLVEENPAWLESLRLGPGPEGPGAAPDGDADLRDDVYDAFRVPGCERCGGVIKPDVVFFGENVPKARVDHAWRLQTEAEVLLVVGSSLTVFSGRRFVYRATEVGQPIGIVNLGSTRADEFAEAKVEGRLGRVLPRLAEELLST